MLPINLHSLRSMLELPQINLVGLTEFGPIPAFNNEDEIVDVDHAQQRDNVLD